ncbi:MAG TPA: hypothetical protein VF720_00700 [Candidatus Eisenbacteria bacterium]
MVADGPVDESPIRELSLDAARRLDIDFVDIGVVQRSVLEARRLDTVYAFELKAGHQVLDGPPDILAGMPSIDPSLLPLIEATRLLVNRGWGLVWARLHLEEARLYPAGFDRLRRRFTINAIHKGVLAAGEAGLILAKRYDLSYRERARRLAELPLEWLGIGASDFRRAFADSTRFKLAPIVDDDAPDTLVDRWMTVRDWHERTLRAVEEARIGRPVDAWSGWRRTVVGEGWRATLRRPRRFLSQRSQGVAGGGFGHLGLDRDHDFRRRLPAILYGIGSERLPSDWREDARRHLDAWHS